MMMNNMINSDAESLKLFSDDYPFNLSLRISSFESEKKYIKFIKNCEKIIRSSNEYLEWRKYIRDVLHNNYCIITEEVNDQVTVEIHHHIPSLFTLVKTVVNKMIDNKKEFCSFDVCLETMEIHFSDKIGYVPLIKSMHEKFHSGFLRIPMILVKGNYKLFLNEYGKYIDDDDWCTIREKESINISNNNWKKGKYPGIEKFNLADFQMLDNTGIEMCLNQ